MVAVVDLAGVSIVRGGSTLLDDITVQIDESDRWVVIGPNGERGSQLTNAAWDAVNGRRQTTAEHDGDEGREQHGFPLQEELAG